MADEKCSRCEVSGEKVRLFDVIYEGRMSMLCERCSIIENIPIIKKPDSVQLKESQKGTDVYDRMKRISGYAQSHPETKQAREQRLKELEKNPKLEMPIKQQLNLIDHFHWEIMKNRRRKGLSHKQLAEAIGESDIALEMLEKGKLPEDAEVLIKKLEQFFQISLRKISEAEAMVMRKERMIRTKPVLLDEDGKILDKIPEPISENYESGLYLETSEIKEVKKDIPWYKKILGRKKKEEQEEIASAAEEEPHEPDESFEKEKEEAITGHKYLEYRRKEKQLTELSRLREKNQDKPKFTLNEGEDLDLEKVDIGSVSVSELKEIHKKRTEATKDERKAEQKKIENKERLIEARKEELRAMKEKESRNIDDVLGGSELLLKNKQEDEFTRSVKGFDDEL